MTAPKPRKCPDCERLIVPVDGKFPIHATDPGKDAPYRRCRSSLKPAPLLKPGPPPKVPADE